MSRIPAISLRSIGSTEIHICVPKRHLHHVQGRDICSCPKCTSVIERDKQIVCSHNGIRHHTEKERISQRNKKEFHKDNTECRGTGTKDVIVDDSINIKYKNKKKNL